MMHFQDLINTIKERRENLRVTQEDLAKLSGGQGQSFQGVDMFLK